LRAHRVYCGAGLDFLHHRRTIEAKPRLRQAEPYTLFAKQILATGALACIRRT
jgi:hypothetical protein